jgi:hypothetical protein
MEVSVTAAHAPLPGRWMKFIVKRNGKEVTGWRKWVVMVGVILVGALVVAVALVFILGLALTAGAILVIAIPVALILALIARLLM